MLKLAYQIRGSGSVGCPIADTPYVPCPHNQLWRTAHPLDYLAAFSPGKNFCPPIPAWVGPALVPREVPDTAATLVPPAALLFWLGWDTPWLLSLPSPTKGSWDRG